MSNVSNLNLDNLAKALGASKDDNIATLTLKAEVIQSIIRLRPDQNYLTHPKLFVENIVKRLGMKERKKDFKEIFIKALR